mmetsp:Transcript_4553/g.15166  ORF Transcript_4553/g.15166 Transcript_4553/m.15166 type:complete len:200 (+) Transcript_4553:1392-1991(+)
MGMGRRPPFVVMLWSSRKMRQSRSVILSSAFSLQCPARASVACFASSASSRSVALRTCDVSSAVMRSPRSRLDLETRAICRCAPSEATTRRSTPPKPPRPNARETSHGREYNGFKSTLVSWSLSQSNLNLNLSEGLVGFFFTFTPPMCCARINSSSRERAWSSRPESWPPKSRRAATYPPRPCPPPQPRSLNLSKSRWS